MRQFLAILTLTVIGHATSLYSADGDLSSFTFEGTQIPCSLAEFKQRYPDVGLWAVEAVGAGDHFWQRENIVYVYRTVPAKASDAATYSFYKDTLFKIEIHYQSTTLEQMGGADAFVDKLRKPFGPPSDVQSRNGHVIRAIWKSPEMNRRAEFNTTRDGALVTVVDTATESLIKKWQPNRQKDKEVDTGF